MCASPCKPPSGTIGAFSPLCGTVGNLTTPYLGGQACARPIGPIRPARPVALRRRPANHRQALIGRIISPAREAGDRTFVSSPEIPARNEIKRAANTHSEEERGEPFSMAAIPASGATTIWDRETNALDHESNKRINENGGTRAAVFYRSRILIVRRTFSCGGAALPRPPILRRTATASGAPERSGELGN